MAFFIPRYLIVYVVTIICVTGCTNSASENATSGIVGFDTKPFEKFETENGRYMAMCWVDEFRNGKIVQGPLVVSKQSQPGIGLSKLGNDQGYELKSSDDPKQTLIVRDGIYLYRDNGEMVRVGDNWPVEMMEDKELQKQFWIEKIAPQLKEQQAEQK